VKQALLAALFSLMLIGCGEDKPKAPELGGEDGMAIARCIEDVGDSTNNAKKLSELFVAGSKPPELTQLKGCMFGMVGKPSMSGTTATAKVKIDKDGKSSEQVWTFEKVGDKWKIKSAPL
jgi:hypothetical protein